MVSELPQGLLFIFFVLYHLFNQSPFTLVLRFELASESPGGLLKAQTAGPWPQSFWLTQSGTGHENLLFCEVPRGADLLVWGPHFKNHSNFICPDLVDSMAFTKIAYHPAWLGMSGGGK